MKDLFNTLKMNLSLVTALQNQSIVTPTEVQEKVIPEALKGKDLVVQSETGSGKTLSYLIPLFEKIDVSKKEMQAIILAPTHELAIQILRQIEQLSQNSEVKVTSTSVIGNVNIDRQIKKLKERPNIIVGSSGRILDLIKKRKITSHTIKTIIIDEADNLMDENNLKPIKEIVKGTLKERQLMMFSASITKETEACAKEIMKEPDFIKVAPTFSIPSSIEHMYFLAEQRDKIEVLRKLVRILNPVKAMVFVGDKKEMDIYVSKLKYHGLKVEGLSSNNQKLDRKKVMDDFKNGKTQLLFASNIAARGLDIQDVTYIFNLNSTKYSKDYLHRVGRTGRMGKSGLAISIITPAELRFIESYEKQLKIKIKGKEMYKGNIVDLKKNHLNKSRPNTNSKPKSKAYVKYKSKN